VDSQDRRLDWSRRPLRSAASTAAPCWAGWPAPRETFARVFSPFRSCWTTPRLNSTVKTRRPSDLRGNSPMRPPVLPQQDSPIGVQSGSRSPSLNTILELEPASCARSRLADGIRRRADPDHRLDAQLGGRRHEPRGLRIHPRDRAKSRCYDAHWVSNPKIADSNHSLKERSLTSFSRGLVSSRAYAWPGHWRFRMKCPRCQRENPPQCEVLPGVCNAAGSPVLQLRDTVAGGGEVLLRMRRPLARLGRRSRWPPTRKGRSRSRWSRRVIIEPGLWPDRPDRSTICGPDGVLTKDRVGDHARGLMVLDRDGRGHDGVAVERRVPAGRHGDLADWRLVVP
jgi:hypothetical protein